MNSDFQSNRISSYGICALAVIALAEVLLLLVTLNTEPGIFYAQKLSANASMNKQLLQLRIAFAHPFRRANTLEHARDLKALAAMELGQNQSGAIELLQSALEIEKSVVSSNYYLDSMEIVDTLEHLADVNLMTAASTESSKDSMAAKARALSHLEAASEIINDQHLYWLLNPMRKLLAISDYSNASRIDQIKNQIDWMVSQNERDFRDYVNRRRERGKHVPADLERGAAIPFLSDYYRTIGRNLGLAGRAQESRQYLTQCVDVDALLPEAFWRAPFDLAELALVNTELRRYSEATENYTACVRSIINNDPDVLFILPQRQAYAHLAGLMGNVREQKKAQDTANDIVSFLGELKRLSYSPPSEHKWAPSDLVQVRTEDMWWSGRVVEATAQDCRIHFVGFPSSQDDWFDVSSIRRHPPYGYADLQGAEPRSWVQQ